MPCARTTYGVICLAAAALTACSDGAAPFNDSIVAEWLSEDL